jgi:predicted transcriptional regulator
VKKNTPKPSDSEMEVLQLLWKNGPMTVRSVHEELNKRKDVGYTTTLKVMQRMNEKKLLKRETNERTHLYEAVISEEDTQSELLDRFLDSTFAGSSLKLVLSALGNKSTTKEDLTKIREYLDKIERGAK